MQIIPINATTYGGKLNLDDVEIGDVTAPNFRPHIKMKRWNGLCDMAISYPTTSTNLVQYDGVNRILRYSVDAYTDIEIFGIDPRSDLPEGAMEFNVILKKKPLGNKNTINLKLETSTIDFKKVLGLDTEYNQQRAYDEYYAELYDSNHGSNDLYGHDNGTGIFIITPTDIMTPDGQVSCKHRDPRLVNSYEGKAKQNYHTKHELGEIRANTPNKGKQLSYTRVSRTTAHIKRGKAIDADGVGVWVEDMNLTPDGTLTITLPSDFIKNARYPVRQAVGLDPAYTEDMDSFLSNGYGGSDGVWGNYDLYTNKGVPKGAVAEFILSNATTGTENQLGVRTDGSALNRYVLLHEAEGGGQTHCRMFVVCHATTGLIEPYHSDVSDADAFYLVGYWENVTFTELMDDQEASSANSWVENILLTSGAASKVCHITCQNLAPINGNTIGVRNTSSGLERKILIHEAEEGGCNCLDMFVKADANYTIDLYTSQTQYGPTYNLGYFGTEMDFVELFQAITNDGDSDWDATDLTAYLDQDGRVVDFLLGNESVNSAPLTLGIRDGDDAATLRYLPEHEAEWTTADTHEVTGFGISAQTNASGVVNLYSSTTEEVFYLTGYFKPVAAGGYTQILYTSEPPTPNAWNQVKQTAGTGWKSLLYV